MFIGSDRDFVVVFLCWVFSEDGEIGDVVAEQLAFQDKQVLVERNNLCSN